MEEKKNQIVRDPIDVGMKVAALLLLVLAGYLDQHMTFQSFMLFSIYLKMKD